MSFFTSHHYLAITTVVQELLSFGRSRVAAIRTCRVRCSPRTRDSNSQAPAARLAGVDVRHIRRGRSLETRKVGMRREERGPGRTGRSAEYPAPS